METKNNNNLENPAGTEGFAFIEYCQPKLGTVESIMEKFGFMKLAKHPNYNITLYQQNQILFFLNQESHYAQTFANDHGPSASALGFKVKDAQYAFEVAKRRGAKPFTEQNAYPQCPAIYGVGNSLIYFADDLQKLLKPFGISSADLKHAGTGLQSIDHVTHNVQKGQMDVWSDFYEKIFNFRQIRYFDIHGKLTGLYSRAMTSPCGKIRIPINESADDQSQISEFLREFNGEGIQHIALSTENIYETVSQLKAKGMTFLDTPDTYYQMLEARIPWHHEKLEELRKLSILMDGTPTPEGGLLLQIFTENSLGPVFFEIIQRKGNEGFGEGNFQALFEAIERDQIQRGVLK